MWSYKRELRRYELIQHRWLWHEVPQLSQESTYRLNCQQQHTNASELLWQRYELPQPFQQEHIIEHTTPDGKEETIELCKNAVASNGFGGNQLGQGRYKYRWTDNRGRSKLDWIVRVWSIIVILESKQEEQKVAA